jgi:hypothetical protein
MGIGQRLERPAHAWTTLFAAVQLPLFRLSVLLGYDAIVVGAWGWNVRQRMADCRAEDAQ